MLRHRKTEPSLSEDSAKDTLLNELSQSWEEAKKRKSTAEKFESSLDKAVERNLGTKQRRKKLAVVCGPFLRFFDCVWTVVLLLVALTTLIVYCQPVNSFLQTHLHSRIYHVNRVLRHSYLAVHPYLRAAGLDLTKSCLIQNPLVNESTRCPCITSQVVTELSLGEHSIQRVLGDHDSIYIIRGVVEIGGVAYGRDTMVQYFREHGSLPPMCMQLRHHQRGLMAASLIDDHVWQEFSTSDFPWDFSWQECEDENVPFWSLLPFKFNEFHVSEKRNISYCLTRQWGKTALMREIHLGRVVLAVLDGRVRVMLQCDPHCFHYCSPPQAKVLLEAGDVLTFDSRFWSYSLFTWSNLSFSMATSYSYP